MLLGACAKGQEAESTPPQLSEADYPGALATTLTGPDFMARQRLHGTARGREIGGEVVLQKQGDALTLIGLTPFSTKAFVAKQKGAEVKVDVFAPEGKLPFPPASCCSTSIGCSSSGCRGRRWPTGPTAARSARRR
ncbi:hypothetical protein [Nannocystis pusilla]|uniref:hypothetical protein n=1 Tax=Nannocystis pusilla TaxID=889268 RepID=UPI003B825A9E